MLDDIELLRVYAAEKSEEAFATLVSRHINLVYSAAMRQMQNAHQAEEITQLVFVTLARKASSLKKGTVLPGWLFETVRLTASNYRRGEMRRAQREQEAFMRSNLNEKEESVWQQVAPMLDEAIGKLAKADRDAIVLRFMEGKNLREVGLSVGVSEEAAKKRVTRALDKLRGFFSARGIALSAAALGTMISANGVAAAPVGLAAAVTGGAMVQGAAVGTSTFLMGKELIMAWTKVKIAVGVGLGVAGIASYQVYESKAIAREVVQVREQLEVNKSQLAKQTEVANRLQDGKFKADEELSKLRMERAKLIGAKQSNAGSIAALKAKTNAASNPFANMLSTPEMQAMMNEQMAIGVKQLYGKWMKDKLTPEEKESFVNLMVKKSFGPFNTWQAKQKGELTTEQATSAIEAQKTEVDGQLKALLGNKAYADFKQFESEVPARSTLEKFKGSITAEPLTADQDQRLLQVLVEAKLFQEATGFEWESASGMETLFAAQAEKHTQVVQRAKEFLSPTQIAILEKQQENDLKLQKVSMAAAQKMMSGRSK